MTELKIRKILEKNALRNLTFGFESIQGYLSVCFWCTIFVFSLYKGDERLKQILGVIALNQLETKMDNLQMCIIRSRL